MICALVLAAGRSRRMGSCKLLIRFGGRPLIARTVAALAGPGVQRVLVVVGEGDEALREALRGQDVMFVRNCDPEGDMLSSVRCGFRALPPECEAVLVVPADQPGLTWSLVHSLVAARERTGASLVVPRGPGGRGHPLLVGMEHRSEVLTGHDGVGLRGLLRAHPEAVQEVATADADMLSDMDTPADRDRLWPRFGGGETIS